MQFGEQGLVNPDIRKKKKWTLHYLILGVPQLVAVTFVSMSVDYRVQSIITLYLALAVNERACKLATIHSSTPLRGLNV